MASLEEPQALKALRLIFTNLLVARVISPILPDHAVAELSSAGMSGTRHLLAQRQEWSGTLPHLEAMGA